MEKFKGKYRIPSARLQTWDYGWNGAYFITICSELPDIKSEIMTARLPVSRRCLQKIQD